MLYQDRPLGRRNLWSRLVARVAQRRAARRADLDLLAMNPHLRRDLGLGEGLSDFDRK